MPYPYYLLQLQGYGMEGLGGLGQIPFPYPPHPPHPNFQFGMMFDPRTQVQGSDASGFASYPVPGFPGYPGQGYPNPRGHPQGGDANGPAGYPMQGYPMFWPTNNMGNVSMDAEGDSSSTRQ